MRTTTQTEPVTTVYQLKISIAGLRPPIWRRVLVPAQSTLADMHQIIQVLMGWYDGHLHEFEVPGPGETTLKTRRSRQDSRRFGPTVDPSGEPFEWLMDDDMGDAMEDEAKALLKDVAPAENSQFRYIYDMGDNWEHDILVEKILPADPQGVYPTCVAGRRNGPLEDVGGVWGYAEMLEILADPKHEEHQDRREWLEEIYDVSTWDAETFDQEGINTMLKKLRPKPKRTARRRT